MNEPLTEIDDKEKKEFQIKISVNLAKCYFEKGEINKALKMSYQNLEQNQLLFGKDHISNVDIYYIIANCNTKLENVTSWFSSALFILSIRGSGKRIVLFSVSLFSLI